jgi:hypothetical protein
MQLIGNFWSEGLLLNLTSMYQAAFPFDAKPKVYANQ